MSKVSLIEEYLLLTLEDLGGEFDSIPEIFSDCGLVGAALMDLALRNKIDSDLYALWATDAEPTGIPILDNILAKIGSSPTRISSQEWLVRLSPEAPFIRKQALKSLCEQGILRQEDHRYMWVLKERRYPIISGQERTEAKRRLLTLLYNDEIPSPVDAALAGLADASFLFDRFLKPSELVKVQPRVAQLVKLDLIGGQISRVAHERSIELRAKERRAIIAGLAGNIVEWYDFGVYGFFAATIGHQFFPSDDPSTSLLASFAVFAIGFIARPVGGAIFGYIGDRFGRRLAVVSSVLLMIIPTLLISVLPTYNSLGVIAPLLLIILRLAQGLAVGGEYTTSMVLLVEESQKSRRGFVGSFAPFGTFGGLLLGSAVGATVSSLLNPHEVSTWGWRIAFSVGLVIGLIVFYIRRKLPNDVTEINKQADECSPLLEVIRDEWRSIIKVIGVTLRGTVGFYVCFVYLTTWLSQNTNISNSTALTLNSIAIFLMVLLMPLAGLVSDRIGHKNLLLIGALATAAFSWPLFALMTTPNVLAILVGQSLFALLMSTLGASPAFMVEAFPKHLRCSGLSISYNIATAIFGGTVPLVATFLIRLTKYPLAPGIYLALISVISFWATSALKPSSLADD